MFYFLNVYVPPCALDERLDLVELLENRAKNDVMIGDNKWTCCICREDCKFRVPSQNLPLINKNQLFNG